MNYLIQSYNKLYDGEVEALKDEKRYIKELLDTSPYNITNYFIGTANIYDLKYIENIDEHWIPIGSLEFVGEFLNKIGLSKHMEPIEIPSFLRTNEFLNRKYKIVNYNDLLKLNGKHFIKNISKLKSFTSIIDFDVTNIEDTDLIKVEDYKNHKYSVQEIKEFNAEYRILVNDSEVVAVQYYNGNNPLLFPNAKFVQNIVSKMMIHKQLYGEELPRSYTIDIGVDKNNINYLLEIHNFISCGTYGFQSSELLNMYQNGINFEIDRQKRRLKSSK